MIYNFFDTAGKVKFRSRPTDGFEKFGKRNGNPTI
jgi:hypothetical protein